MPAVTNKQGEAKTCAPHSIPSPRDAYSTHYSDGVIVARIGGRESSPGGPFAGTLVLP